MSTPQAHSLSTFSRAGISAIAPASRSSNRCPRRRPPWFADGSTALTAVTRHEEGCLHFLFYWGKAHPTASSSTSSGVTPQFRCAQLTLTFLRLV